MKKLIALLILISILATAASAELYARNAVIIDTDPETETVAAIDDFGDIWVFYCEDTYEWDLFDSCILIFDSGEVIAATYTGQADIERIIWICEEIF